MHTKYRPERLVIRPPSEWRSMLIRSTRGCNWNRCRFCGIYPALGEPLFSVRPVEEVKRDIIWYCDEMPPLETAFLGDADPLCRDAGESEEILAFLSQTHPHIERVTAYARASTLYKLGFNVMQWLAAAGLTRIHMGLESGDAATLKYHWKGQGPKLIQEASEIVKSSGIELSVYVLLGLGGRGNWQRHIEATAAMLCRIQPDFIRIRRLWIYGHTPGSPGVESPLIPEIQAGRFLPQPPEGTVQELRLLLERLDGCTARLVCDHGNNFVPVEGNLAAERISMIKQVDDFLALPATERDSHYSRVNSRI